MKIRFYHWWIYKLYYRIWNPIFTENPDMVRAIRDWNQDWLDQREYEIQQRRKSFYLVKKDDDEQ